MKRLTAVLLAITFYLGSVQPASAVSDPPLFSCQQPVGSVIAAYEEGTHGIPGDTSTHTGSDYVYKVDDAHVLQCFCPEQGQVGIQSNWWKVLQLSMEEVEYYVKRGWVYVPNGQLWGLDESPYLVKNASYECRGVGGSNGSGGSSNGSSSTNNSTNDQGGVGGAGAVLGEVLGVSVLAATGGVRTIFLLVMIAGIFAWLAYRLRKD